MIYGPFRTPWSKLLRWSAHRTRCVLRSTHAGKWTDSLTLMEPSFFLKAEQVRAYRQALIETLVPLSVGADPGPLIFS